jgi:hypothetical protein
MPVFSVGARAGLVFLVAAVQGIAQTSLNLSAPAVLLNSSEARAVRVSASKGGPLAYKVADLPAWLTATSANNYTTPDALYFQIRNSLCGTCTATVKLIPESGEAVTVDVRYSAATAPGQMQLIVSSSSVNLSDTLARTVMVSVGTGAVMAYTMTQPPDWLTVSSANHFTTPDTLYFQLARSNCGTCTAALTLLPSGSRTGTPITVAYDLNSGSSYRTLANHVTLAYPAGPGGVCGPGFVSGCSTGISSVNSSVQTYSAKVNRSEDAWILMNLLAGSVTNVPLANGLNLSVNPAVAGSMASGAYTAQVVVYNPANQGDMMLIDVSLLLNPGSLTVSPASGAGGSQTFTLEFPHPGGWQNLTVANLLINGTLDGQHACYAAYELATGRLLLLDDEAKDYESGANSQCGLRLDSANGDGNTLKLTIHVTFTARFAGKKNIYLAARDNARNNSGWQLAGTWEVRPPPQAPPAPPRKKKK